MQDDAPEGLIAQVAAELKKPVTVRDGFAARVMTRVRATRPDTPVRAAWEWLREPRAVAVSPLGGLALAAAMGAIMLLGAVARSRSTPTPAPAVAAETADAAPVTFVLLAPQAQRVALAGDFNGWDAAGTPLARGTSGLWTVEIPLAPGRYTYAFLVDGRRFVPDPAAPRAAGDDFGTPSSVVTVQGGAL